MMTQQILIRLPGSGSTQEAVTDPNTLASQHPRPHFELHPFVYLQCQSFCKERRSEPPAPALLGSLFSSLSAASSAIRSASRFWGVLRRVRKQASKGLVVSCV